MKAKKNVHTEHCCIHHGCKYNEKTCPVTTGQASQSFACELCEDVKHDKDCHLGDNHKDCPACQELK